MALVYDPVSDTLYEDGTSSSVNEGNAGEQAAVDYLQAQQQASAPTGTYDPASDTYYGGTPTGTTPVTGYIGGIAFTQQSDGSWQSAAGNTLTSEQFAALTDDPANINSTSPTTGTGFDFSNLATKGLEALKNRYVKPDGSFNFDTLKADGLTLTGLASAARAFKQADTPQERSGYKGVDMGMIPKYTAVRSAVPAAPGARPGAGGQRYFTDINYANAAGLPAAQTAIEAQKVALGTQNLLPTAYAVGSMTPQQKASLYSSLVTQGKTDEQIRSAADTKYGTQTDAYWAQLKNLAGSGAGAEGATVLAAQGGLMGLAKGGKTTAPRYLQGKTTAPRYLQGKTTAPRYLQGKTDGMADEIPATIDGNQPAALAHGEFVIPADVVSHLGNGNSDAGAQQLYKMMDKIRHARTGNKKQGKRINPDKFTLGGQAYAAGGHIPGFAGATDGSYVPSGTTGIDQNLATWAGPYVTDMLAKTQALATQPYTAYAGPLTAGTSALSQQAYDAASAWRAPTSMGTASTALGTLATTPTAYQATQFGNQYQAPTAYQATQFGNTYKTVAPTEATQFTNQYKAPAAYVPTDMTASKFDIAAAQEYMNPYLRMSLDPQLAEARRQSDITQTGNAARAVQANAFGGSRAAIMEAENQRNLGTNQANITGQGYNTAYGSAQAQFNADQSRAMAVQQSKEQANQFGSSQVAMAAQLQAQYGMSALQATELARQFQMSTAVQQAQNKATAGIAAMQASEQSKQFGATQGMAAAQLQAQYGTAANQAAEQSKQFGANLGLQSLQQQIAAAQGLGSLGIAEGNMGLNSLAQMGMFGLQQQAAEQAGINADIAAFNAEKQNPYTQLAFQKEMLSGLPITATTYDNGSADPYLAALKALGLPGALTTTAGTK